MLLPLLFISLLSISSVFAFRVPVSYANLSSQTCTGMWTGDNTYINVTYDNESQGQVAMVIYEWADAPFLGKADLDNEYASKTYLCTYNALARGFCTRDQLGHFILDLPHGQTINDTSFWSALVLFPSNPQASILAVTNSGFQRGPIRHEQSTISSRQNPNPSPTGTLLYSESIHYRVTKTGYYCVAILLVSSSSMKREASTNIPYYSKYSGNIFFKNIFDGQLEATDYPKLNFYLAMSAFYAIVGLVWGRLCWKCSQGLLPLQNYLSFLLVLLITDMVANWAYYHYLNVNGKGASAVFPVVVTILDAGKTSMSLFVLLVAAMGLSVVKDSSGTTMLNCRILAVLHLLFSIIYSVGIVELSMDPLIGLFAVFSVFLPFSIICFLLWIIYALNVLNIPFDDREQRYTPGMFGRLYCFLLLVALALSILFVGSFFIYSGLPGKDSEADRWRVHWWLLDGWFTLLYPIAFCSIAFLWRPSKINRSLVISDEIVQDENDAEDPDPESLNHQQRLREDDDDNITVVGARNSQAHSITEDRIVSGVGDEGEGEVGAAKKGSPQRVSEENVHRTGERESLIDLDDDPS